MFLAWGLWDESLTSRRIVCIVSDHGLIHVKGSVILLFNSIKEKGFMARNEMLQDYNLGKSYF